MQDHFPISSGLSWALIERLLSTPEIKGSGNMRLQHIGLFVCIYIAQRRGFTVTTQFLSERLSADPSSILRMTKALEKLGYIKREKILASHGRGRAFKLTIALPKDMVEVLVADFLMLGSENK